MSKLTDIKAARDATAINTVYTTLAQANTAYFHDVLEPEEIARTLILLVSEVKRLSDAVAQLQQP